MKEIPLTQGKVALVDDAKFLELSAFRWCAAKAGKTYYAVRKEPVTGRTISMHRQLTGFPSLVVDHLDTNGLNNQLGNLRVSTSSDNGLNRREVNVNNTSGVLGVSWYKKRAKWAAWGNKTGLRVYLGVYSTIEEAALAVVEYDPEKQTLNKAPRTRVRRDIDGHNSSGVVGVGWHKEKRKWQAEYNHNGRRYYVGRFEHLEDAAMALINFVPPVTP